jgi:hypothetical protein
VQNSVDFVNFGTLGGTRLFTRLWCDYTTISSLFVFLFLLSS